MDIVTGYCGKPHVTAEQDRAQNQGAFGTESYVLSVGQKMKAEVQSNNQIRIRDGILVHQGCTGIIKTNAYDAVTIQNGTQGMKRIDLIVARYSKETDTGIESLSWKVIQGTPAASNPVTPSYTNGDIQGGSSIVDMPMYKVNLDGINITSVDALFEVIPTMASIKAQINKLNSNMWPVGSIYLSVNNTNPGTLFGGTWEQIKDRFLLAAGSTYSAGSTGGEATHKLTESELPSHNHSFSATTGSSGSHLHTMLSNHHTVYWGQSGSATHLANSNVVGGSFSTPGQNTLYMNPSDQGTNYGGSHTHSVSGTTGSKGGSSAHNNMPPYLTVYVWKRIK